MDCPTLNDLIEPWASGELSPPPDAIAHVASCRACAARLAMAREIDAALATAPIVAPSALFTSNVLQALRRVPAASGLRTRPATPRDRSWTATDLSPWTRWNPLSWGPASAGPLAVSLAIIAVGAWSLLTGSAGAPSLAQTSLDATAGFLSAFTHAAIAIPPYAYVVATGLLVAMRMLWQWTEEGLA